MPQEDSFHVRTVEQFGDLPGGWKWRAGVLGPDGVVYGIPDNATSVLAVSVRLNPRVMRALLAAAHGALRPLSAAGLLGRVVGFL